MAIGRVFFTWIAFDGGGTGVPASRKHLLPSTPLFCGLNKEKRHASCLFNPSRIRCLELEKTVHQHIFRIEYGRLEESLLFYLEKYLQGSPQNNESSIPRTPPNNEQDTLYIYYCYISPFRPEPRTEGMPS